MFTKLLLVVLASFLVLSFGFGVSCNDKAGWMGTLDIDPEDATVEDVPSCQDRQVCTVNCKEWYGPACDRTETFDMSKNTRTSQTSNFDDALIVAYYYACIMRSYQNCGKVLLVPG